MAELHTPQLDIDDFFNFDFTDQDLENKRVAVRYVRRDILVFVKKDTLLKLGKFLKFKLHDISSKGILISSEKKFKIKTKLNIHIYFKSGTRFIIKARIIRVIKKENYFYGIKFEKFNHALGDHLLETQEDLIIK